MLQIRRAAMSERSDRLQRAWREWNRGKLTIGATADQFGWNPNTFKSNLNGNMDFSFAAAKRYGAKLKVRPEWLYDGTEPMRQVAAPKRGGQEVPLIAWVSAGRIADIGQLTAADDTVLVGDLPDGEYFATNVVGDSMDRISPEGSTIIVRANEADPRPGRLYVFSLRGEATYKRFEADPVPRLEPVSTNPANKTIYLTNDKNWTVVGRVVRSILDLD